MATNTQRKLSTVLFADIVGYTALMSENEAIALEYLEQFKNTLVEEVPNFQGEIKNFYGDGCLAAFPKSSQAINCSKALQDIFQKKYNIPVRIGLDRGWIVLKDGNIFGDAVNLASRIEAISSPGGVLLSKKVKEDVTITTTLPIKSIGSYHFKNIKIPQEVFGLDLPDFPLPDRNEVLKNSKVIFRSKKTENWKSVGLIFSALVISLLSFFVFQINKNSSSNINEDADRTIAVLPFKNLSTNDKIQFFGDGMLDAILDNLVRIEDLQVTSRTSADKYKNTNLGLPEIAKELDVKYILEGTVQQYGSQMRIIAQLIELPSDKHLWSRQYDSEMNWENILLIQKEVSKSIANELKIRLNQDVLDQIEKTPTNNSNAYQAYLKGKEKITEYHKLQHISKLDTAIQFFQEAIEHDDQFAKSYIGIANAYWFKKRDHNYFQRNFLDTALLFIDKALALNPYLADGYLMKGDYYFEQSQFALSEQSFRRALELEPNNPYTTTNLGMLVYFINGKYKEGLQMFEKALRTETAENLNELYGKIGMLYTDVGDFDKAKEYFNKGAELNPYDAGISWVYHCNGEFEKFYKFNQAYRDSFPEVNFIIPELAVSQVYVGQHEKSLETWKPFIEDLDTKGNEHYLNRVRCRYGYCLWEAGKEEEAKKQFKIAHDYLEKSIAMNRVLGSGGAAQYDLAAINAFLGNKEKAYQWLSEFEKTGWRWGSAHYIKVDPLFDGLRKEERFKKIVNNALAEKAKTRKELSN